ncbi:MAG: CopD family protein, partial [Alphaproteobacteria bacterium]
RLLRAIMNPAMIATYIFGLALLFTPGVVNWGTGWIYVKLILVAALTVLHHLYGLWRKDFERDANTRPAKFYKIANELPTLGMIAIVIMVIVKPF